MTSHVLQLDWDPAIKVKPSHMKQTMTFTLWLISWTHHWVLFTIQNGAGAKKVESVCKSLWHFLTKLSSVVGPLQAISIRSGIVWPCLQSEVKEARLQDLQRAENVSQHQIGLEERRAHYWVNPGEREILAHKEHLGLTESLQQRNGVFFPANGSIMHWKHHLWRLGHQNTHSCLDMSFPRSEELQNCGKISGKRSDGSERARVL